MRERKGTHQSNYPFPILSRAPARAFNLGPHSLSRFGGTEFPKWKAFPSSLRCIYSLNSMFHIFIPPAATDADTRDEEVTFLISGPDCGIVSLTSRPGRPLTRFTQADVRNGRVLFTHTGKKKNRQDFWSLGIEGR